MTKFTRPALMLTALLAAAASSTAAHATTVLYSETISNEYLNDLNVFGSVTETLDTFTISGQPFNLAFTFSISNDSVDLLGPNLVNFASIVADKNLDFAAGFAPYSLSSSGSQATAIWNGLSAGTYDLNITFNGNTLGFGDGRLNGTLTATTVPEPGYLALGAAGLLVGFGGKRLRRKAA
jgi:hypothetical protein